MSSILGNIMTTTKVEQAVVDTLDTWLDTYIAEVEVNNGFARGDIERPFSIQISTKVNKFDEDRLPAIVVVSPGLAERPVKDGSKKYRAKWIVGIACIVKGRDRQDTDALVKIYTAAVRALIIQKPGLGLTNARGVEWVDEDYDELDSNDRRTLKAGLLTFWVEVGDVVTGGIGPTTPTPPVPSTSPLPDWPTVEEGKTFLTTDNEGTS